MNSAKRREIAKAMQAYVTDNMYWSTVSGSPFYQVAQPWMKGYVFNKEFGYPRKTGQLEDSHRDLKCRKARPRWLRTQKPEALMLQSVPPYVDTQEFEVHYETVWRDQ